MAEASARVSKRRRISVIWLVPIVAILLGAWMVVYTYRNQGPRITIVFSTAEGIEAGKTKIKARSVDVGLVETVVLRNDLESVLVTAQLEPSALRLLREDTVFWVVRARVGAGGVSGLGTIVSGGYIQLAPGVGPHGRRHFVGLEDAPVTPVGTPGLNVTLWSDGAGSLGPGDPIFYKSYRVGRVEGSVFDVESQRVRYEAFVEEPYDSLVTDTTRFWNTSGITFSASADGIELQTGSLESLIFGGLTFGLPTGAHPGAIVEDGAEFDLYRDFKSVNERPYRHAISYVAEFAQSVRGLEAGAPVEYRGLRSGTVERVMLAELTAEGGEGEGRAIPVLIRLDPGRLEMGDSEAGVARLQRVIASAVDNGLRATLSTGSLLTGSLYVSLDIYANAEPAEVGVFAGHPTIPTVASGLQGLEQKLAALLDKLNAMPIESAVVSADETLKTLRTTLLELNALIASDAMQSLPASLEASLAALTDLLESVSPDSELYSRLVKTIGELDRTLQRVDSLATTLDDQPNALVFPRDAVRDPEPQAGPK